MIMLLNLFLSLSLYLFGNSPFLILIGNCNCNHAPADDKASWKSVLLLFVKPVGQLNCDVPTHTSPLVIHLWQTNRRLCQSFPKLELKKSCFVARKDRDGRWNLCRVVQRIHTRWNEGHMMIFLRRTPFRSFQFFFKDIRAQISASAERDEMRTLSVCLTQFWYS